MTDDLTKRRPQDARKINVNERYEVIWWCTHFVVSEAALRAAVKEAGVEAAAVAKHFGKLPPDPGE